MIKIILTFKLEILPHAMRALNLLLFTQILLFSCTAPKKRVDQKEGSNNLQILYSDSIPEAVFELTPEQETAFDALNSIQVKGQHLYSTFSGIHHDCFPPDTSFVISRAELQIAIEGLLVRHYPNISDEQRAKLVAEAVFAQEEYLVLQCGDSTGKVDHENNYIPTSGSWILPRILGQRDVVLKW